MASDNWAQVLDTAGPQEWADALIPAPMTDGKLTKIGDTIVDLPPRPADAEIFPGADPQFQRWFTEGVAAAFHSGKERGPRMAALMMGIALANGLV